MVVVCVEARLQVIEIAILFNVHQKKFAMRINLSTLAGSKFEEDVQNCTTVEDLKHKLVRSQNVSYDQVRLLFNGTPMNDDKSTVASYNVTEGSTIHLVMDNKVLVKLTIDMPDGKSQIVTVDSNEKVETLKMKIQAATGFQTHNIELEFEGKAIASGRLPHYRIRDGSKLRLKLKRIQVTVMTMARHKLTMDVSYSETVEQFKARLHKETDVPAAQQRLICNGRELNTGRMVDYGLRTGSVIDMVGRLRGG